ncbi:hypothetical protein GALL_458150 [mine drainage metagenome]|uniref:Uncharacterized protein n=1 Tax=mine drainage metagenome TaxID=410659 RepID=A0A1J5Q9A2_9ZZZZ
MRAVTDQARLVSQPPGKKLAGKRRTAFLTAAALVAVVAIVCAIAVFSRQASSLQHNPGPAQASGSPVPTQFNKGDLTDQEYAFARDVVRREVRRNDDVLTSATVTASYGTVTDSNIGYPCMSGRLLHINLIGDFPHTVTDGHAVKPGDPMPDFTVHAVDLTADAKTGRVCLVSVQTGKVAPEPGAVSLPVN